MRITASWPASRCSKEFCSVQATEWKGKRARHGRGVLVGFAICTRTLQSLSRLAQMGWMVFFRALRGQRVAGPVFRGFRGSKKVEG